MLPFVILNTLNLYMIKVIIIYETEGRGPRAFVRSRPFRLWSFPLTR